MRVIFGAVSELGDFAGVMSIGFLLGTPIVIGALTIHDVAEDQRSALFMIFGPWSTVTLMLFGCAVTLLEGSICVALMAPIFLVCGSIGGLATGFYLRFSKTSGAEVRAIAVLPFLLLIGEANTTLNDQEIELKKTISVAADARTVWGQILTARSIRPDELPLSLTHAIGVPKPIEGVNKITKEGEIRYSESKRGVKFEGLVTDRKNYEMIRWEYRFGTHSFPRGSMDEHVAIGGRFFDLQDTTFNLRELSNHHAELQIVAHYRVASSINFYAVSGSKVLGRDFINTILHLYNNRSERVEMAQAL